MEKKMQKNGAYGQEGKQRNAKSTEIEKIIKEEHKSKAV